MKVHGRFVVFLGLAVWWMIPLLLRAGWLGYIFIVAAIIGLAAISIRFRSNPRIVTVWIPLVFFAGFSSLAAIPIAVTALIVLIGYHPQDLFGALSAGVFVLVAIPIAVTGVVAAVILFLSFKYRPKSFPQPLSYLAILNTLAVCVFIDMSHQTAFGGGDSLIVHVLDSQGQPVGRVKVSYACYDTRNDGATESQPEDSGSKITDDNGTIQLSASHSARHIVLDLSRDGYEKIKATIVNDDVGMGEQGYRVIHVQLVGRREDAAQTYVSNKHPIEMKLYLPTNKEAPSSERQLNFGGAWPSSGEMYLKLSDGTLTEAPDGDLKFEIIENVDPNVRSKHFKVTALNGASLTPYHILRADSAQGIKNESFKFDDMMNLAPPDRYTDNLMIDWLHTFYYRSPDGKQYARIELIDLGGYQPPYERGPKGKIFLWTINSP